MTVLEVKPHKVYIRDLVPYRTAVMFFMAAFLLFYKKIPTLPTDQAEVQGNQISKDQLFSRTFCVL